MSKTFFSFVFAAAFLMGALVALQAMPTDANEYKPDNELVSTGGVSLIYSDENGLSFYLNSDIPN